MSKQITAANGNPHICATCKRALDPVQDAVVYLGWGKRHDGRPGLGWVAALCAPTPSQMGTGSPCVQAARDWAGRSCVELMPSDLTGWLG